MQAQDWRALIEAYLAGRLGADGFRRRFVESFEFCVAARRPVPEAVQTLYFTVEAYGGDPMGRGHDVADDRDLKLAAETAFRALALEPALAADPRVSEADIEAAEADIRKRRRRAAFTLGAFGAGGCAAALAYLAIGVLQLFASAAQIQALFGWGPAPSTILGAFIAFTPILGSITAFFGAKDVWAWPPWAAAAVFFAIPALTLITGWRQVRSYNRS